MKQFNKLSILIAVVLVTSVGATVDLCCAAVVGTDSGLLKLLGYTGPVPYDIFLGCTLLEDSCELVALTCDSSYEDNIVGIDCVPANSNLPTGGKELCCVQVVSTNENAAKQALSQAGYEGSDPLNVALGCTVNSACLLVDLRCQQGLADNTVGVTCVSVGYISS